MKSERHIVSIVREIASERGLGFEAFSYDWILRLSRGKFTRWFFGYDFDINSSVAQILAKDKAGTSLVLNRAGVPHVAHVLFSNPQNLNFVPAEGTTIAMHRYAQTNGWNVVLKPNEGTGGLGVTRITTPAELEDASYRLFAKGGALALSPFIDITDEYRCFVLDNRCLLIYRKVRQAVKGDGRSTRLQLLTRLLDAQTDGLTAAKALAELGRQKSDLSVIVPANEMWHVNWKHNLALGSRAELLSETGDAPKYSAISELARRAAAELNLRFGSVDIVESNRTLRVLELNSGVMMESLVDLVADGRTIAKRVYSAAVDAAFGG